MGALVIGRIVRSRAACALLLAGLSIAAGCRNSAEQRRPDERPAVLPGEPAATEPTAPASPPPAVQPPGGLPSTSGASATSGEAAAPGPSCAPQPFATEVPIAEASGSIAAVIDGVATVMVIADSGHQGDYLLLDAQTGAVRERGKLPLGGPGDDLEGLAVRGDRFWALTSSGWLRAWTRRGGANPGFDLVAGPSPIGPVNAPAATAMVCDAKRTNCGRNFEGLCLLPQIAAPGAEAADSCVGMAASKADGRLYCVVERAGQLQIDPARSLAVSKPDALSDCNIDGETLWASANLFDFNRVWRVDRWRTPAQAQAVALGSVGVGFGEAMAVAGETMYRFSDTQGSPSLVAKFRCVAPAR